MPTGDACGSNWRLSCFPLPGQVPDAQAFEYGPHSFGDTIAHHVFARQALYDRVWAEPMRTVASTLGVSDVGLAKACRAAGIPTPPRGWWARLQHNKPLPPKPPLPGRPGKPDQVVIAPSPPKPVPSPAVEAAAAAVADDLRGGHAIIRDWVAQDAERRREYRRHGWGTSGLEDLTTPLARRRLRLTSAVLKGLAAQGLELGEDREWLFVRRGQDRVEFRLYARSKIEHRPATADELRWRPDQKTVRATVLAGDLMLKIKDWLSVPTEYRELKTPLEAQLTQIVANLAAGVAEQAERRRERERESQRWAEAEAVRKKQAAYGAAQGTLRERLIDQADRRRTAEAIRDYVAAADGSLAAEAEDYAGWRAWAVAEADGMDPLLDGSAPFNRLPPLEDWEWRGW